MARRTPDPWSERLIRWLMPAVALASGLGWVGEVAASSTEPAPAWSAEEHAHYCQCLQCRGTSCCCKPKAAKTPAPAQPSVLSGDGPCLGADPCGNPGLPPGPSAGPMGKAATPALSSSLGPAVSGEFLPLSPRCALPEQRASRIDDPPEFRALA